jgi:hypothetical protein
MEVFHLTKAEDSPEIVLDKEKGVFLIEGNSFVEDPETLYKPVLAWFDVYDHSPNITTIVEFKMNYLNTASTGQLIELLMKLEEMIDKTNVQIKWYYLKKDDDLREMGEVLNSIIDLDFEFIEK